MDKNIVYAVISFAIAAVLIFITPGFPFDEIIAGGFGIFFVLKEIFGVK